MRIVHFRIVNDFGLFAEDNACCGNNFRRTKKLTDDWEAVTCPECIRLCGFDQQPVETVETVEQRRAA